MRKLPTVLFLIVFSGCAVLEPYVRDFNLVSVDEEKQMSTQMAAEVSKKMTIVTGTEMNQRVSSIGRRLAGQLPSQQFNYEFFVVQDNTPNAFTIPGGKIYVHTGLLTFVSNDNELAGVIAHELGHAYERHPAKNISRQYGAQTIEQLILRDPQGQLKKSALDIAAGGLLLRYSRQDELEADSDGFKLLCRSGYNTNGLTNFLRKLLTLQKSGRSLTILSTHPDTAERVTRLESMSC